MSAAPRAKAPAATPAMQILRAATLPPAGVYLLSGPDDYLREQVLDRLRAELLEPGFAEFNHRQIQCTGSSKVGTLANAMVDLPMMADRRLLELHEAQTLPADAQKSLVAPLEEAARSGSTVIALCWRPAAGGGRGRAAGGSAALKDAAARIGVSIDCALAEDDRGEWVQGALQRMGVKAESAAVAELLKRTGTDLRHLASQLDKLALYAGKGATIKAEDVRKIVLRSTEVKTWELTDAIGKKNLRRAVEITGTLLEEGDGAGPLLSYLNTWLRSLAQVQSLHAKGMSALQAAMPNRKDWMIQRDVEQVRTWSVAELRLAFDMLCRADLRIKTGSDPRLVLELLLVQLCMRRGPSR